MQRFRSTAALFFCAAFPLAAQSPTVAPVLPKVGFAALIGEVRSVCYRLGVREATVLVVPDSGGVQRAQQTTTDSLGRFALSALPAGHYKVRFTAIGLIRADQEVALMVGRVDTVRVALEQSGGVQLAHCLFKRSDGSKYSGPCTPPPPLPCVK